MRGIRWAALSVWMLVSISSTNAKDDQWTEARSKNFIVVSNASGQQARKVVIQFEQIRELFQRSFVFTNDHPTPVITILAAKDENTLRELLPEFWETKGHTHPAGIFLDSFYQLALAVQLSGTGDNPYEAVYHEYYHSLTIPYFPGLPVWIAEGMADFYGNSKISDKTAYLGMPNTGLIFMLHQQPLVPLPILFHVDHASPYYNEGSKTSIFYAESWALIHYLMLGDKGAHRRQLIAYLDALEQGQSQEEAATKAFGDLSNLQRSLQSYTDNSAFYQMETPAPVKVSEGDVKVRLLTNAEADAYRGGFLVLQRQFREAEPLLQEAVRNDRKLAIAEQNLAILYYAQRRPDEARTALDAAIELDPKNALTHFLRGSIGTKGSVSERQDSQGEADLRAAIAADPNFAPAYSLLAARLATDGLRLSEAFELAKRCVSLEPGNSSYQLVLANVLARLGKYDLAHEVATRAAANTLDPHDRENATRFMEYLQKLRDAKPEK